MSTSSSLHLAAAPLLIVCWMCTVCHEASSAAGQADGGLLPPATKFPPSEGCPCLSQAEVTKRVSSGATNINGSGICQDGTLPGVVLKGQLQGFQCLPAELGSDVCRAWGLVIEEACQAHGQSAFYTLSAKDKEKSQRSCRRGWCYVDKDTCYSPHQPSELFPGAQLWYSYETCGFLDTNAPLGFISQLRSLDQDTVRVTYPGNDVYRLWRDSEGKIRGLFPDIASEAVSLIKNHIVTSTGTPADLDVIRVPISQNAESLVQEEFGYSSSYTACAVMLGMNLTDICIGPWSLPERHALAQYVYPWDSDEFYMVSFRSRLSTIDLLTGILLPFELPVWGLFLLAVLVMIVAFAWVEIGPRMAATMAQRERDEGRCAESDDSDCREMAFKERIRPVVEAFVLSTEVALDTHPEGYNPLSNGGKILKVSFALFLAIFVATYTANLAAILGSQTRYEFEDLAAAADAGVSICVPAVLAETLSALDPRIRLLAVPVELDDILDSMDEGLCRVGFTVDAMDDVKPGRHCNKALVGRSIATLPVSALCRPFYAQYINLMVTDQVSPVRIIDWRKEAISDYSFENGIKGCPEVLFDEDNDKLNIEQMAGLFLLFAIVTALAVLADLLERIFPKWLGRISGIAFDFAGQGFNHCYLRDPCKDTYVLRMPPGLHYSPDPDLAHALSVDGGGAASVALRERVIVSKNVSFASNKGREDSKGSCHLNGTLPAADVDHVNGQQTGVLLSHSVELDDLNASRRMDP